MNLHDRIKKSRLVGKINVIEQAYNNGLSDAAQLATEADALMGELSEALLETLGQLKYQNEVHNKQVGDPRAEEQADAALKHYQEYVK